MYWQNQLKQKGVTIRKSTIWITRVNSKIKNVFIRLILPTRNIRNNFQHLKVLRIISKFLSNQFLKIPLLMEWAIHKDGFFYAVDVQLLVQTFLTRHYECSIWLMLLACLCFWTTFKRISTRKYQIAIRPKRYWPRYWQLERN